MSHCYVICFNIIHAPASECILCLLILFTHVHILCAPPPHTAYPMSLHGVHVLCMVCTFCAWCACSVYGVQVLCMVYRFCALCASSVHGVQVLCMVCMFCAWCARSVHGCSLSISTSQAHFQPLYIFMYMYIEVAVCHFIIIILQLQYNVCSSVRATEPFCQKPIRVRE